MKRKASALTLIIVLVLTLAEALLANSAKANFMPYNVPDHNIEIANDGNVTGTNKIQRDGKTYVFTDNINGSIVVWAGGDVTIDGAGYTLQGNGFPYGIFIEGRKGITVKNMTITGFDTGVVLSWMENGFCSDNTLMQNTITNNRLGISCYIVDNINISENVIANNEIGVSSFLADGIHIQRNTISGNGVGVQFKDSDYNVVSNNNFINNTSQAVLVLEMQSLISRGSAVNWSDDALGNFWSDYRGMDADGDGVGDSPYVVGENSSDNYPLLYPFGNPEVAVFSLENSVYSESFSLTFSVNKPALWMGYSLDEGGNVTVNGNTTLSGLAAGLHNVTVYAIDIYGVSGASKTVTFTFVEPSVETPFPIAPVAVASAASAAVIGAGLLVYFKKHHAGMEDKDE